MKTLYTMRPSDGRIMRYDNVWTELGFVAGSAAPRLDARMAINWFKHRGQLWCVILTETSVIAGQFVDNNIQPRVIYPITPQRAVWGNIISYNGVMCWLEQNETGVILYSFNETNISAKPVDIPGYMAPDCLTECELKLALYGAKLVVLPHVLCATDTSEVQSSVRSAIYLLEISEAGDVIVTSPFGSDSANLNTRIPTMQITAGAALRFAKVGAGVYQDKLVALFADGAVGYLADEGRSVLGYIGDEPFLVLNRTGTIQVGSDRCQAVVNMRMLSDTVPFILGSRILVGSGPHAGTSGTVVYVQGNMDLFLSIDSHTDQPFPALDIHTDVSFSRGVGGGGTCLNAGNVKLEGPLIRTFFFEIADAVFGFVIGRYPHNFPSNVKSAQPSFLMRIRGNAVVTTPLVIDNKPINATSVQAQLDREDSSVHIIYYDSISASVRHARYSIAAATLSDYGKVYDTMSAVHLSAGNFIAFNTGELDVTISAIEVDAFGDVSIHYDVFGTDQFVINFSYHAGDGWKPATGTTPTPGVFVHSLRQDLPTFSGDIQYRADILRA